ncbi:HAD hydrolase-like protein [Microtetraspora malaysiensis]|uniref:HAD hydrolase-like protein n=1 Tax=Microtetraspora malaysiensis TaxID=161358 RepID=UPI003D941F17
MGDSLTADIASGRAAGLRTIWIDQGPDPEHEYNTDHVVGNVPRRSFASTGSGARHIREMIKEGSTALDGIRRGGGHRHPEVTTALLRRVSNQAAARLPVLGPGGPAVRVHLASGHRG